MTDGELLPFLGKFIKCQTVIGSEYRGKLSQRLDGVWRLSPPVGIDRLFRARDIETFSSYPPVEVEIFEEPLET